MGGSGGKGGQQRGRWPGVGGTFVMQDGRSGGSIGEGVKGLPPDKRCLVLACVLSVVYICVWIFRDDFRLSLFFYCVVFYSLYKGHCISYSAECARKVWRNYTKSQSFFRSFFLGSSAHSQVFHSFYCLCL